LIEQVTDWAEGSDHASVLFSQWIHGEEGHSKADQVLGSLGLSMPEDIRQQNTAEWMRQRAYVATMQSIILVERGQGKRIADINRQYDLKNLEGVEERWRDSMLWLLNGLAKILEIRTFYFHLREDCEASDERVKRLKRLLGRMRYQTYELQEQLKYCSPLGPVLRDIRQVTRGGVGVQTIRTLEQAGITNLQQIQQLGIDGLRGAGIRRDIAQRIMMYLRRRLA
jgi:hypothetical protein